MNTKNILENLFKLVIVVAVSSCARVQVKDGEFCGDLGSEGAVCFNLLSDGVREISANDWDDERFGMICSKAETFTNLKTVAIQLCNTTKRCSYEEKQNLIKFQDKIIYLDERKKEITGEDFELDR